jgi:hypothetical protein
VPARLTWFARAAAAQDFCTIAVMSSIPPPSPGAPERTSAGQLELVERKLGLTQRQRTVLFLVDGRRGRDEIGQLARQAGADARSLDGLIALGLVQWRDAAGDAVESALMPSSLSLSGDSSWSSIGDESGIGRDRPLDEARRLLMRAVRSEAPLSGALTLLRLKRATTLEELQLLLDEVEQRLRKPHRQIIAAQTMRHVRHLLDLAAAPRSRAG